MGTLNLGILAHVDAGKTTLTERLLYAAGATHALGSVDAGTTQTDTMALERQRGITIRAAVASFAVDDMNVNIIDTPGHPDFIAEVDRSLSVLDGAVLVISAVEGVQAQSVVLMRALQRLSVPMLIFVNKIDRPGADGERAMTAIAERLTRNLILAGSVHGAETATASFVAYDWDDVRFLDALVDVLVDNDDNLLAAAVDDRSAISQEILRSTLATQTAAAQVHPVFFGSAITGAGIPALMSAITTLLPAASADPGGPTSGSVFKVERGPGGEKIAYVRMFAGTIRLRERLQVGRHHAATVTGIRVFADVAGVDRSTVTAGEIAKLSGLSDVSVGDTIGTSASERSASSMFAPPTLETVVVPSRPEQKAALHAALAELADQDPLINLRQDDVRQELFVSLYGEVQKEVIRHTLGAEFGIDIEFRDTTAICIERPSGAGEAIETLGASSNPFLATIGLRVEPGTPRSGLQFRLEVELRTMPLYVYKTVESFQGAMEEYVRATFQQGLSGWEVTDCMVTMTDCGYTSPATTAGDFRKLTPLVLMAALRRAGTLVCEPIHRFHLEAPAASLAPVLRLLAQIRAAPQAPTMSGPWFGLTGAIPAAELHRLRQQIQGLTRGEGVLVAAFDRYEPVVGVSPTRPRSDNNPLKRKEYLRHVLGRMA